MTRLLLVVTLGFLSSALAGPVQQAPPSSQILASPTPLLSKMLFSVLAMARRFTNICLLKEQENVDVS